MALTPETLTRHELNGLPVRVADASNPDLVGIAGRVVVETKQTLHVDSGAQYAPRDRGGKTAEEGSRVKQVPKQGTTFEFRLPAEDCQPSMAASDANVASARTDERAGSSSPTRTDEAASGRKTAGAVSKRPSETAGVRPGQSGDCEGAVYVTVDGARLLSRPALRTETAGDSIWQSD